MSSIIVVGGGIFGVTAALELRRRGHAVALFDPGPLPHPRAASTDISKVIRMDYGAEDFYWEMMEEAFPLWDEWNARWKRPLYHETGIIFITSRAMAPGGFEYESFTRLRQRGIPVDRLDNRAIRERFPAWNADRYVDGYFNPRAGWAESGAVVSRLLEEAAAAGVELRAGEAFAGLLETGSRVSGILTAQGERRAADSVILTAGSWTPRLLPELEGKLWPNGQFVFHFWPPDPQRYQPPQFPVWAADLLTSGWYGFPVGGEGVIKVANHGPGWRVDPREQSEVPPEAEVRFRAFLRESIPSLAEAPLVRTRLCFYCDSFDGDFLIARPPGREGLLVCAGDSGHAFKFAPVLGPLIADALEGKPNRFLPRFAWREPEGETGAAPRK
jgi:glycine/D-amino acid oxidase-like deaminating enzyme